jgi:hypothetical protein
LRGNRAALRYGDLSTTFSTVEGDAYHFDSAIQLPQR